MGEGIYFSNAVIYMFVMKKIYVRYKTMIEKKTNKTISLLKFQCMPVTT